MKTYICAVCGKEFEAVKNAKYCPLCREKKYRENDRISQKDKRAKKKEIKRNEIKQSQMDRERRFAEQEAERMRKLQADADAGDLLARLRIALTEKDHLHSVSYWKAVQDYELDQLSSKYDYAVNGLSVHDPDFPQKVTASLDREKMIVSHLFRNT